METKQQPANHMIGRLIFFVFLAGILGVFWYFSKADKAEIISQKDDKTAIRGSIVYAEGAVEYKKGEGDWKRALVGTELAEGDSVEIIGDGKAIVNLDDGSAVRLNGDSIVVFEALSPNHIVIKNEAGQIYTRVAKMDNRVFEVLVDDIVFESIGTAYKTINKEKIKGVEVYENKVKVKGVSDEFILVEEGNKYLIVSADDKKVEKVITKITAIEMNKDEFVKWNLTEDKKMTSDETEKPEEEVVVEPIKTEVKKTETVTTKPATTNTGAVTSISISHVGSGKVKWTINGYSKSGFKAVWSKNSNPTYPTRKGDKYKYYSNPDQRTVVVDPFDGYGTYYVRVCEYINGKCGVYSNQITVKLDAPASGEVQSISLVSEGDGNVRWKASGYSKSGFKLVWSKNSGPTYPNRTGDKNIYYSDSSAVTGKISAFDGSGLYYARVCEYISGKCGVYSNQIEIKL